ncbi:hypothetical protein [Aureibacter tunicatorum]|uniref:Uncharacterized protein n=1 Tax=Aureibacter tunicatorum TaxID=866807 RepID=A0AAE3XR80_9BACT|nr:hypothetical protein [Aureibacter tunicatorum]MDR6239959.1 hypothetical protein [Aureibacter tunicatorum]BDD04432.1 hypothetical protein AUTU_19150 [Aureibacter tunicatorum]
MSTISQERIKQARKLAGNRKDKASSTYSWYIWQQNNPKFLKGYSKWNNLPERADKDTLLQECIERLYNTGYFNEKPIIRSNGKTQFPLDFIEFCENNNGEDVTICVLFISHYELGDKYIDNKVLINFLNRFYELVETGETSNLVKKSAKSKENMMSLKRHRFRTLNSLYSYSEQLINTYHFPKGVVQDFIRKYSEKYFSEGNESMQTGKLNETKVKENNQKSKKTKPAKNTQKSVVADPKNKAVSLRRQFHKDYNTNENRLAFIEYLKADDNIFNESVLSRIIGGKTNSSDEFQFATFLVEKYGTKEQKSLIRS